MSIDSRCPRALVALLALAALGGLLAAAVAPPGPADPVAAPSPGSVILLIGDGMGPQAIGLFLDAADAEGVPAPALAGLIAEGAVSVVRTRSADSAVTDSAASATAMASGVDTANGRVGVAPDGAILPTCLEDARAAGRATALVTTTRLTHATPACFAAHVRSREDENAIGRQLLEAGVDILLGGGANKFLGGPGGQSLPELVAGYRLVRTADELAAAPREGRLLGLFAASDLPYRIDRDGGEGEAAGVPSLAAMTRAALERLDPARGFFLMVEGGRIDHAGHANDAAALLGEMAEFDEAIAVARAYIRKHPEVALIVTADHETGGLCLTSRGDDGPKPADLVALARAERSAAATPAPELDEAGARAVFGAARLGFVPKDAWARNAAALDASARRFVSFGSYGHSATPVLLIHVGAGERFGGLVTHADLGRRLRAWMSAERD